MEHNYASNSPSPPSVGADPSAPLTRYQMNDPNPYARLPPVERHTARASYSDQNQDRRYPDSGQRHSANLYQPSANPNDRQLLSLDSSLQSQQDNFHNLAGPASKLHQRGSRPDLLSQKSRDSPGSLDDSRISAGRMSNTTSVLTRNNITIVVDDGRDYVRCKESVNGKAIWRYMKENDHKLNKKDYKLLTYCIGELARINRPYITTNMELRIYSQDPTGINPVFYSGNRKCKFVAVWLEDEEPQFIEVKRSIFHYVPLFIYQAFLAILIAIVLIIVIGQAFFQMEDFMLALAGSFNATINIVGSSKSDLSFDALDININMNAGGSDE